MCIKQLEAAFVPWQGLLGSERTCATAMCQMLMNLLRKEHLLPLHLSSIFRELRLFSFFSDDVADGSLSALTLQR